MATISNLVRVVESASQSLPLVPAHTLTHARQIRVQNYEGATRSTETRKALELRQFSHGHTVRAIQEHIAGLQLGSDPE